MNVREKGKRIERHFANELREFFPSVERNGLQQSASGGVDLVNTGMFNVEVKGGKAYKSKMIRKMLDQVSEEGDRTKLDLCLVKPEREEAYAVIPFDDFKELLRILSTEKII